jgi:DNA-binding CsgD family transcriptional regulator
MPPPPEARSPGRTAYRRMDSHAPGLLGGQPRPHPLRSDGARRVGDHGVVRGGDLVTKPSFNSLIAGEQCPQALADHLTFAGSYTNEPSDEESPASPQVSTVTPRDYRMTRRLTPDELSQVLEMYRLGLSTYKLARQFGMDRHTITGHLRRGGVTLRSRQRLTAEIAQPAKQLYGEGYSLAGIGRQLGLADLHQE